MDRNIVDDVSDVIRELLPTELPGATFDTGTGELLVPVGADQRARVSTNKVVDHCSTSPRADWPGFIRGWINSVKEQIDGPTDPRRTLDPAALRVRLVPSDAGRADGDRFVRVPYGRHFVLEVVVDAPGSVELLSVDDATTLGMDVSQATVAGMRRTVELVLARLDLRDHELSPGLTVRVGAADGVPYVSAGLMSVPQLLRGQPLPYGALVAAPQLSAIVLHPVTSKASINGGVTISRVVESMYDGAADPCSRLLFWLLEGELHPLQREDQRLAVPGELESMVAALPD